MSAKEKPSICHPAGECDNVHLSCSDEFRSPVNANLSESTCCSISSDELTSAPPNDAKSDQKVKSAGSLCRSHPPLPSVPVFDSIKASSFSFAADDPTLQDTCSACSSDFGNPNGDYTLQTTPSRREDVLSSLERMNCVASSGSSDGVSRDLHKFVEANQSFRAKLAGFKMMDKAASEKQQLTSQSSILFSKTSSQTNFNGIGRLVSQQTFEDIKGDGNGNPGENGTVAYVEEENNKLRDQVEQLKKNLKMDRTKQSELRQRKIELEESKQENRRLSREVANLLAKLKTVQDEADDRVTALRSQIFSFRQQDKAARLKSKEDNLSMINSAAQIDFIDDLQIENTQLKAQLEEMKSCIVVARETIKRSHRPAAVIRKEKSGELDTDDRKADSEVNQNRKNGNGFSSILVGSGGHAKCEMEDLIRMRLEEMSLRSAEIEMERRRLRSTCSEANHFCESLKHHIETLRRELSELRRKAEVCMKDDKDEVCMKDDKDEVCMKDDKDYCDIICKGNSVVDEWGGNGVDYGAGRSEPVFTGRAVNPLSVTSSQLQGFDGCFEWSRPSFAVLALAVDKLQLSRQRERELADQVECLTEEKSAAVKLVQRYKSSLREVRRCFPTKPENKMTLATGVGGSMAESVEENVQLSLEGMPGLPSEVD